MESSMKLSMVSPLYQSAPYIPELHRRLIAASKAAGFADYEIIFVVDGSPDNSLDEAQRIVNHDPKVTVIDLARNYGQHKAIMTGLAHSTGDYIFIIDGDLEEEPEWIIRFHHELIARNCDVVFGVNKGIKRGYLYSHGRRLFYKSVNLLSAERFPENVCAARLMTRRYVNALLQFKERELFFVGVCHMAGFAQMPIEVVKRDTSPSSYSPVRLASLFIDGVTAFSTRPLIMIAVFGIILSIIAIIYLLVVLYLKIFHGVAVEGWASVMGATLLIGGITLFFNGITAIYISKIFSEVKQRPYAIIRNIYKG
jgi:putative glycosyltransferase